MKSPIIALFAAFLPLLTLLALSTGCQQADVRTFSLDIKNNSSKPITVGLTKNGPPLEVAWESPVDRALMDQKNTGVGWGIVVQPGKTAFVNNLTGEFARGTSPFLRIYQGALYLNDILAISEGSRLRTDVRLREGKTYFNINDKGPFIDVTVTGYEPTGEQALHRPVLQTAP